MMHEALKIAGQEKCSLKDGVKEKNSQYNFYLSCYKATLQNIVFIFSYNHMGGKKNTFFGDYVTASKKNN